MILADLFETLLRKTAFFSLQDWVLVFTLIILGVGAFCFSRR